MSARNQPPEQAVATLPVFKTLATAFPLTYGNPGLLLRAAAGGLILIAIAAVIFLLVPTGMTVILFLLIAPLAAWTHFGVNWYRIVLLGPQGMVQPLLRWDGRHWRVFAYALGINIATMVVQLPLTLMFPFLAPAIALAIFYVTARLSFIFPALAVAEEYTLGLSWRHTAGQGLRLAAALLIAGLPLYLLATEIVEQLFASMIGAPMAAVATMGAHDADALARIVAQISPFSIVVVVLTFVVLTMAVLAVEYAIVALAFVICTGWVPAASTEIAKVFGDEDDDENGNSPPGA